MGERIRRSMPCGLMAALVLVASVECWLARHGADYSGRGPRCWELSGRAAYDVRGQEVLGFGTSLVKAGFLPRVIEARSGWKGYNLAVFSGPMPASYFLLRRALASGARPKAVVVDSQDGPIDRGRRDRGGRLDGLERNERVWPELLDARDALDLAWTARDASFLAATLLAKALPSYRTRREVRAHLLGAFRGATVTEWDQNVGFTRNLSMNRGAFVSTPRSAFTVPGFVPPDPAAAVQPRPYDDGPAARNKLALQYARRFLALAEAHGIRAFWLLPPFDEPARIHRERTGEADYLLRVARRLGAEFPTMVVVDGRHAQYPPEAYSDPIHLNAQGAKTLSSDLALIMSRTLADPPHAPRWVELPRYRAVAVPSVVEDIGRSREIAFGILRQAQRK